MNSPNSPLPAGSTAPGFSFEDREGQQRHTDELAGKAFVVYFYPRDDTPGCTKEACSFRDHYAEISGLGATVIGVSPDSLPSHRRFREKFGLPFGLAADTDKSIARAYGTLGPKKFMGRAYEGIHRVTFIVDAEGRICEVFDKVKPAEHAEEVIDSLEKHSNKG